LHQKLSDIFKWLESDFEDWLALIPMIIWPLMKYYHYHRALTSCPFSNNQVQSGEYHFLWDEISSGDLWWCKNNINNLQGRIRSREISANGDMGWGDEIKNILKNFMDSLQTLDIETARTIPGWAKLEAKSGILVHFIPKPFADQRSIQNLYRQVFGGLMKMWLAK